MIDLEQIKKLKEILTNNKRIAVITGAGISTPSGIPDIRSSDGLANSISLEKRYGHPYEEIVSHSFFMKHTEEFFRYYKEQMVFKDAKPNAAHIFLKDLEKDHIVTIITQNIDGLHHVAGSSDVVEFHGTVQINHCMNCGEFYPLDFIMKGPTVPTCPRCGGIIKPDVVLFEEGIDPSASFRSMKAVEEADVLLVIGSSLAVYPAAGLVYYYSGKNLVIINKDKTPYDSYANLVINDNIVNVIKELEKI